MPLLLPCAQAAPPDWPIARTVEAGSLRVSLSPPVLVARDKGYLWFPTLSRLSDGRLLALMSDYADIHTSTSTAKASWSDDGGLTWSVPVAALYSDSHLTLDNGDLLLLPYYLRPREGGRMGAAYQTFLAASSRFQTHEAGALVDGLPRPDRSFAPELGLSGFVFNGQTVRLEGEGYLATLYGYFEGAKRYSLLAAASPDGVAWTVRSIIADENCPLQGSEGPCEAALCRLADGKLLCVFRLSSAAEFGRAESSDGGRTWSTPEAMPGVFSVQPSLALLESGTLALSGGRPGILVWLASDGRGKDWQRIDLVEHHNHCLPDEPISTRQTQTSSYTEIVAAGPRELLCIYDRVPHGWSAIPSDAPDTNSVWVVRLKIAAP